MKTVRHISITAGLAACLLVAPLVSVAGEEAADAIDWAARAKGAWHKTCRKCHAVPDTRFETDRAFLRQIIETT